MRSTVASTALLSSSTIRTSSIGRDQQRALDAAVAQVQAQGNDHRGERQFLPERRLLAQGPDTALVAGIQGPDKAR